MADVSASSGREEFSRRVAHPIPWPALEALHSVVDTSRPSWLQVRRSVTSANGLAISPFAELDRDVSHIFSTPPLDFGGAFELHPSRASAE